jgi:hypothetical protein
MLLRVGQYVINPDRIILAEYGEEGGEPHLFLRLAGGGHKDHSYTPKTFSGEPARKLWEALTGMATLVTEQQSEPGWAGPPESERGGEGTRRGKSAGGRKRAA